MPVESRLHELAAPYRDLFERRRSFIFLVSHMRSYSSLLGHLLASTREVDGYAELHQSYESELDLIGMALNVQKTYDEPLDGHRLFDKILHRRSTLATEILVRSDVHVVLAARTPGATLASMIALGSRDPAVQWAANPDRALLYYQRRLLDLQEVASRMERGAVLIADELVRDNAGVRAALATFLELDSIPDSYELRSRTGQPGFGDSSPLISSRSIQPPSTYDVASVPAGVLADAATAFDAFLQNPAIGRLHQIGELDRYR